MTSYHFPYACIPFHINILPGSILSTALATSHKTSPAFDSVEIFPSCHAFAAHLPANPAPHDITDAISENNPTGSS